MKQSSRHAFLCIKSQIQDAGQPARMATADRTRTATAFTQALVASVREAKSELQFTRCSCAHKTGWVNGCGDLSEPAGGDNLAR